MSVVYVSDLDGTLLTNEPALSPFSESELHSLLADGLPFTVASARSVQTIRTFLGGLPLTLPVVSFNGAFVSDLGTGRHAVVNALPADVARELCAFVAGAACEPFVSTYGGDEDRLYLREPANEGMLAYLRERLKAVDPRLRRPRNLTEALTEQVVCLTVIEREDLLRDLEVELRERFEGLIDVHFMSDQYTPGWHWLTIHDHRATKEGGIRSMMELCGLAESDLVVFGDNVNDVCAFGIASEAVAVSNASPDLMPHATHVIGSNEEDSVVRYIREHWDSRRREGSG